MPVAIDFNMLHTPMPAFHVQQASPQFAPDQNIFQPMPQHPMQGPLGPNLHIDTSSGYHMDMRHVPMSATASEASEYASPGFFGPGPNSNSMPAADFNTPYSMPYLSPSPMMDQSHMIHPSVSPLSQMSHADPVIADQSPPLSGMHRSASADLFNLSHESSSFSDEGLMLSEMYSKQNLNLPMPSPHMDDGSLFAMHDQSAYHTPRETMDDMSMMPFGTIDPNALQASHSH